MPILSSTYTVLRQGFLDYLDLTFRGTTTANGTSGGTTFVDTTDLVNYAADTFNYWWALVTSGSYSGQTRQVSDFTSAGTVTVNSAYGGQIVSSVTYELMPYHPTNAVRWAINRALQMAWPNLHRSLIDENLITGNMLRDGGFEDWTSTTVPTYWVASGTITYAQGSTAALKRWGRYSLKATAGGTSTYTYQSEIENPWLLDLAGRSITKKVWCYADTASHARITVSTTDQDGTATTTNSAYHDGDSRWTILKASSHEVPEDLQTIQIRLSGDVDTGVAYWDHGRIVDEMVSSYILPDIWQARTPDSVQIQQLGQAHGDEDTCDDVGETAPFMDWPEHTISYDDALGLYILRFTQRPPTERRIRLIGAEYISEVSAEADTVPLDTPQAKLLYPLAGYYLYDRLAKKATGQAKQDYLEKAGDCQRDYQELKLAHIQSLPLPLIDYGKWRW